MRDDFTRKTQTAFACLRQYSTVRYTSGKCGNQDRDGVIVDAGVFRVRLARDGPYVLAEIAAQGLPSVWMFLDDVYVGLGMTPVPVSDGELWLARLQRLARSICGRFEALSSTLSQSRLADTLQRARSHSEAQTRMKRQLCHGFRRRPAVRRSVWT